MHLIAIIKDEQLSVARYNIQYSRLLSKKYTLKDIFIPKACNMYTLKNLKYLMC